MKEHIKTDCTDPECSGDCMDCCCFICTTCGLGEGCLTTECPGEPVFAEHADSVYDGLEDYRNGTWVNKHSPSAPGWHHAPENRK